jgi:hypothetical protein
MRRLFRFVLWGFGAGILGQERWPQIPGVGALLVQALEAGYQLFG